MTKEQLEAKQLQLTYEIAEAEKQGEDTTLLYAQLHIINESLKSYQDNDKSTS